MELAKGGEDVVGYNLGVEVIIVAALCIALVFYAIGRRVGNLEGLNRGKELATLAARRQSLIHGCCPICQKEAGEKTMTDELP